MFFISILPWSRVKDIAFPATDTTSGSAGESDDNNSASALLDNRLAEADWGVGYR